MGKKCLGVKRMLGGGTNIIGELLPLPRFLLLLLVSLYDPHTSSHSKIEITTERMRAHRVDYQGMLW